VIRDAEPPEKGGERRENATRSEGRESDPSAALREGGREKINSQKLFSKINIVYLSVIKNNQQLC